MARIRSIKPEILEDERTASLSDSAFRLFVAVICLADDFGNIRADQRWLEGQVWWARRESPRVAAILRELTDAGLADLYRVRSQAYLHINGWTKHQRIDNAGKPRVPGPDEADPPGSDGSPRLAEIRGEIPLDPDQGSGIRDQDQDQDLIPEPDPAASPPRNAKAKHRLPDDWTPVRTAQPPLNHERELERFRNHAAQVGRLVKDWEAAWRNWILIALEKLERLGPAPAVQGGIKYTEVG